MSLLFSFNPYVMKQQKFLYSKTLSLLLQNKLHIFQILCCSSSACFLIVLYLPIVFVYLQVTIHSAAWLQFIVFRSSLLNILALTHIIFLTFLRLVLDLLDIKAAR